MPNTMTPLIEPDAMTLAVTPAREDMHLLCDYAECFFHATYHVGLRPVCGTHMRIMRDNNEAARKRLERVDTLLRHLNAGRMTAHDTELAILEALL